MLDLLVVGGLTVDRFDDGSSAPGGSVVHVAQAADRHGVRLGILTATGPEPDVRRAIDQLRGRAVVIESSMGAATTTYRHAEAVTGRQLWLERTGPPISVPAGAAARLSARAVLFAPIAGEVGPKALAGLPAGRQAAILQGWLRTRVEGEAVRPVPLSRLPRRLIKELAGMLLLVASREDLRAEAHEPSAQLRALRLGIGPNPILVVTDGPDGAWIDEWSGVRHLAVPRRVEGVSTVGAGDVFAAFTLLALGRPGATPPAAVRQAMMVVVEMLDLRSAGG